MVEQSSSVIEVKTLFGQTAQIDLERGLENGTIGGLKQAALEILGIPSSEALNYSLLNSSHNPIDESETASNYSKTKILTLVKSTSIFSKAWFWIFVQGLSSITLTLANKQLSMQFTSPLIILSIQNIFSVFIFLFFDATKVFPFRMPTMHEYLYLIPTSFFFAMLTWTSLEGLRVVSVPLVTVTRNLVPLLTAIIESLFFGYQANGVIKMSLLLVFVGSTFYSFTDFTLKWNGFHWVILNTFCSVVIPIAEKRILNNLLPNQTPTGMNFARNLLSIPMLLTMAFLKDDVEKITTMIESFDSFAWFSLVVTSMFGFSIGLSYFFLLKLVSNTSISIANATYKLLTLFLSFAMFGVTFSAFGWIGVIVSFVGVFAFSYESSKPKQ